MQSGSVRVTTYVPGWAWRCQECGWLGVDHTTEEGARHEADRHLAVKHAQPSPSSWFWGRGMAEAEKVRTWADAANDPEYIRAADEWMNAPMGTPGPDDDLPHLHRAVYGSTCHIRIGATPWMICGTVALNPERITQDSPDFGRCEVCFYRTSPAGLPESGEETDG